MDSTYSKLDSTSNTNSNTNQNSSTLTDTIKDNFEKIEYEDVKNEEAIFDVFKSIEYTDVVSNIIKSIDNHYNDIDTFDDYPYFRVQNTCKFIPKLNKKSDILSERQLRELHAYLPYYNQYKNLKLIYSTSKDGCNLKTFYQNGEDYRNSVLVVKDDDQNVFGVYASEEFRNNPHGFYGTGETFLFSFFKTERIHVFNTSGLNDYFIYSDDKILCFGCSDNYFSLSLEKDFLCGYSRTTSTFKNPNLSSKDNFFVTHLELWAFGESS